MSKNGIALAVLLVEAILSSIGVEFDPGSVEKAVEGTLVAVALVLAVYNQLNRPDVKWFFKKEKVDESDPS